MTLTAQMLVNAEADLETLSEVVNGGAGEPPVLNRAGASLKRIAALLAEIQVAANDAISHLGYEPPVAYAGGLNIVRQSQTVEYGGEIYGPLVSQLPLVTAAVFDPSKWYHIQKQNYVATRAALAGIPARDGQSIFLTERGRAGMFTWRLGDYTAKVTGDPQQGLFIAGVDGTGAAGAWERSYIGPLDVKWFGAIGDGATDDSVATQAAWNYAVKTPGFGDLYWSRGTYRVGVNLYSMAGVANDNFSMFGDGPASRIKLLDNVVDSKFDKLFFLGPDADMDSVQISNISVDNNARGQPDPAVTLGDAYGFQQAHSFQIFVAAGKTVKRFLFENVHLRDPVADGINNGSSGTVGELKILGYTVTDRTRVRSDVEMSILPEVLIIEGMKGHVIEFETNVAAATYKRIAISNCVLERLDILGLAADNVSGNVDVWLNNVSTTVSTGIGDCTLHVHNCRLKMSADGRINNPAPGSVFSDSAFYLPYVAAGNTITPMQIFWTNSGGRTIDLLLENCRFYIDSTDPAITPTGYGLDLEMSVNQADAGKYRVRTRYCRFDKRIQTASINAYRGGDTSHHFNVYAGGGATGCGVRVGTQALKATETLIEGGDFRNVVNGAAAIRAGQFIIVDQATGTSHLRMTGNWVGVLVPSNSGAGAVTNADSNGFLINDRRMQMTALPVAATGTMCNRGDIIVLEPTEGKPDSYRATKSGSGTGSSQTTWRMLTQAGVKKDTTANRPAGLTANDAGTRFLDTTLLATDGKPISWNGAKWVDSLGVAA